MVIDVRGEIGCVYVTIGDWTFYIDDSTDEAIVNRWHKDFPEDTVEMPTSWKTHP